MLRSSVVRVAVMLAALWSGQWCGVVSAESFNASWSYTPSATNALPPSHRWSPGCFSTLFPAVLFGEMGGSAASFDVWAASYSGTVGIEWSALGSSSAISGLPNLILNGAAVQSNGVLASLGGDQLLANGSMVTTSLVVYSSDQFRTAATYMAPWSPRLNPTVVSLPHTNTALLIGGVVTGPISVQPFDVWLTTNIELGVSSWQRQSDAFLPSLLSGAASAVSIPSSPSLPAVILHTGGSQYATNGSSVSSTNQVWSSTDLGVTWTQLASAPWTPRSSQSQVTDSYSVVYVYGGVGQTNRLSYYLNDLWYTTDMALTWTAVSATGSPFLKGACMAAITPLSSNTALSQLVLYGSLSYANYTFSSVGQAYSSMYVVTVDMGQWQPLNGGQTGSTTGSGWSAGATAGLVVAGAVVLALAVALTIALCRRQRGGWKSSTTQQQQHTELSEQHDAAHLSSAGIALQVLSSSSPASDSEHLSL